MVEEKVITLTANEPQNHFVRAHEYLAANDPKAAAAEVRIAAGYLDMQASRKGNADQQELRSTSNELRQLADRIARTTARQTESKNSGQQANQSQTAEQKELSQAFAGAEQVLARHFQREASSEINRHRPIMAGHDLDAATAALTASCTWSGEKCASETAKAIEDARRLSDDLLSPTPAGQAENDSRKTEARNHADNTNKPQGEEARNAESNGEVQPAAARISGNQAENAAETNRVPPDASKVVDELGKAINDLASQNRAHGSDQGSAKPGTDTPARSGAPQPK